MDKVIQKLDEIDKELDELKKLHHSEGSKKLYDINALLERIIKRIYPNKDAEQLIKRMYYSAYIDTGDDKYYQDMFISSIDMAKRVIKTIKEEFGLFGFEDFKPIKEKIETEVQIGSNKLAFWRRKKIKEAKKNE